MAYLMFADLFVHLPPAHNFGLFFEPLGRGAIALGSLGPLAQVTSVVVRLFFWALLAPLCWVIAYLRFRETEV